MGSITHLHERPRPAPLRIASDEEVLTAAGEVIALGTDAPAALLVESLVSSGLLAISIPSDFDGADVSNGLIAQVVSQIAQVQPAAARALVQHFRALELVRNSGSEEQRRSIYLHVESGERLSCGGIGEHTASQRYFTDGIGFRLSGALEVASLGVPDWFAVLASSEAKLLSLLLVQRGSTRTELVAGSQPARYRLDEAHVPADAVLALHEDALPLSQSLGTILHASTILGEKRQRLGADLALWRGGVRSGDRPWDERIGKLQVDIEILAALIDRAATALDLAQVNPSPAGVFHVCRSASALEFAALPDCHRARDSDRLLAQLGRTLLTD
ncbi:acyl-CoA dehydrogenase family protein [Sinorhizobium sp. 7-81]|uniref:acyl-CoA dehydrogenase family protein n=1 Tax=Sinorhizobium sp. 8-89 TaxID=3049089 RepID=UPI0024C31AC9|nr:acyl-CoA dehydrogenase family protein [Sinorhizobium sp. 8-89]MDK1493928.1 acyl-CoA dehydrogenase family protein [Sinorhizobium sp. 8-89]